MAYEWLTYTAGGCYGLLGLIIFIRLVRRIREQNFKSMTRQTRFGLLVFAVLLVYCVVRVIMLSIQASGAYSNNAMDNTANFLTAIPATVFLVLQATLLYKWNLHVSDVTEVLHQDRFRIGGTLTASSVGLSAACVIISIVGACDLAKQSMFRANEWNVMLQLFFGVSYTFNGAAFLGLGIYLRWLWTPTTQKARRASYRILGIAVIFGVCCVIRGGIILFYVYPRIQEASGEPLPENETKAADYAQSIIYIGEVICLVISLVFLTSSDGEIRGSRAQTGAVGSGVTAAGLLESGRESTATSEPGMSSRGLVSGRERKTQKASRSKASIRSLFRPQHGGREDAINKGTESGDDLGFESGSEYRGTSSSRNVMAGRFRSTPKPTRNLDGTDDFCCVDVDDDTGDVQASDVATRFLVSALDPRIASGSGADVAAYSSRQVSVLDDSNNRGAINHSQTGAAAASSPVGSPILTAGAIGMNRGSARISPSLSPGAGGFPANQNTTMSMVSAHSGNTWNSSSTAPNTVASPMRASMVNYGPAGIHGNSVRQSARYDPTRPIPSQQQSKKRIADHITVVNPSASAQSSANNRTVGGNTSLNSTMKTSSSGVPSTSPTPRRQGSTPHPHLHQQDAGLTTPLHPTRIGSSAITPSNDGNRRFTVTDVGTNSYTGYAGGLGGTVGSHVPQGRILNYSDLSMATVRTGSTMATDDESASIGTSSSAAENDDDVPVIIGE